MDRQWLAATLWPESDEERAAANLRRSLNDLRNVLGTEANRITASPPRSIVFEHGGAEVDVLQFDTAISLGDPESLAAATRLYRGPLLEGCSEIWAVEERERREAQCIEALETLAEGAIGIGDPQTAIRHLRRAIRMDPYREHLHCQLMEALVQGGDSPAAEQVYRDLHSFLHRELNVHPGQNAELAYARLRAHVQSAEIKKGPRSVTSPASHLPARLTRLIDRDAEIRSLTEALDAWRLVTVTGPGGIGKTSLTLEVGRRLETETEVRFVGLGSLDDPLLVAPAVAASLGMDQPREPSIAAALIQVLQGKALVLLLDNCEHVLDACRQMAEELLRSCDGLRILATSRQSLGLDGELAWELGPLTVPDEGSKLDDAECAVSGAVSLFVERASQVNRQFRLEFGAAQVVAAICRQLDGVPLAIELAASWARSLTAREILQKLTEPLELLVDRRPTPPARHRSVAAAIEWSFNPLDPELKDLLVRLSLFRGGWTMEAAEAVCGASLNAIAALRDRSLVSASTEGETTRYRMLYPIQAFAAELSGPNLREEASEAHALYYLSLAERADAELSGARQKQWLGILDREMDNLRSAIAFAVQTEHASIALRFGASLGWFWWSKGYYREGRRHLESILTLVSSVRDIESRTAYGMVLCASGWLHSKTGEENAGRVLLERALQILEEEGYVRGIGRCLVFLANLEIDQFELSTARDHLMRCLALHEKHPIDSSSAPAFYALGRLALHQYDYDEAERRYSQALDVSEEAEDAAGIASALMALGHVAERKEKYKEANDYLESALAVFNELGDRRGIALTLTNAAECELAMGDRLKARSLGETALELWRDLGQPYGIADALFVISRTLTDENDAARERAMYGEACRLYRRVNDRLGLARAMLLSAKRAEDNGDSERSLRLCGAAHGFASGSWKGISPRERDTYLRIMETTSEIFGPERAKQIWFDGVNAADDPMYEIWRSTQ